jgi:putative ABC transport system ATP-binding protein
VADGLFTLEHVTASRAGRPVLTDLSVSIEDGATAVLGPSGAGKSTLLRLLNRLADPDSGSVRFRGQDVRSLDPLELRRRACLVPQLPAPLPGTAADNVRYGPALCDREADVDRCLELAGLSPDYAERRADRLSVGEQQRLMLARALALEPEVLLLDEPTSALDERARAGVEATLARLVGKLRVSAVIVTHDRAQARRLATRTIELADGRVA